MNVNPIVLSIPIFFLLIGIEVLYDRWKKRKFYRLNDALNNISCGIVEQVTGVFLSVYTIAVYHFFYTQFALFSFPKTWYWAVILFVGVDFFYYWAHRMSHQINLFWLGHVIHHQSEDYNFSVALRQGALQKVFTVFFYIPLALIGFETTWFLFVGAFTTLYQFWIHTEAIKKMPKWFEFIFNTPSHHRVHHGKNSKYIDKNHGGTFIIFDRMFGTFQAEEERPTYGITVATESFDPVWSHLKPFVDLRHEMNLVSGLANKFKVLFMGPGWAQKQNNGKTTALSTKKYNTHLSSSMQGYLLIQYIVVLGFSAWFLFRHGQLNMYYKIGSAAFILLSVMSIGRIFDKQLNFIRFEYIRLFLSALFYYFVFQIASMKMTLSLILLILLSAVVYSIVRKKEETINLSA